MAVGVMNAKFRRAFERRTIMSTWGSMLPESRLAVRFVQRCRSCNQTQQRSCARVVCVDEEAEHQKAVAWFRLALELFPRAQWICHSDDDVYLQARQARAPPSRLAQPQVLRAGSVCTTCITYPAGTWQVHAELSSLTPWREAYGLVNMMKTWHKSGPYKHQFSGLLESLSDPPGHTGHNGNGIYPFLQGGFYALTRDLVQMLIPEAVRLWTTFENEIHRWQMGEDGFIFYALHLAAGRANANYSLRHLTWTRAHYLTARPQRDKRGGMGWVHPSAATTLVHWLKSARRSDWNLVRNITGATDRPAFPAFRLEWHPRAARFEMDPRSLERWQRYLRICGTWGCHAPHRGGSLSDFLVRGTGSA